MDMAIIPGKFSNITRTSKTRILWVVSFVYLFILLPIVFSAPPVSQVQQFTEGYVIKVPMTEILPKNQTIKFNFHVYNISTGMPIASGLTCYFHLYNSTGNHIYESPIITTIDHLFDYEAKVDKGNFTKPGYYSYVFQCNSTSLGGYVENLITVTPNGEIPGTSVSLFYITLLFIIIFLFVLIVILFFNIESLIMRVTSISLGYLLLVAISFIAWQMSDNFVWSSTYMTRFFYLLFQILMFGALPLFLGFFAWYFLSLMKIKEIQDLINKGIPRGEAEYRVKGGLRPE